MAKQIKCTVATVSVYKLTNSPNAIHHATISQYSDKALLCSICIAPIISSGLEKLQQLKWKLLCQLNADIPVHL